MVVTIQIEKGREDIRKDRVLSPGKLLTANLECSDRVSRANLLTKV